MDHAELEEIRGGIGNISIYLDFTSSTEPDNSIEDSIDE